VVDSVALAEAIARGELAENACRKDFTPSEMVAIAEDVLQIERELARQRQLAGRRPSGNFPEGSGETRDRIAAPLGISGRTLEKARAVVRAAEAEPERFGKLVEDMDRTGRVGGIHKRLRVMQQADAIRAEPPPLPGRGPYRVITADPPWETVRGDDPSRQGMPDYPLMTIAEIAAMPVASIAAEDSILWLWTTNYQLLTAGALNVLGAWGFRPIQIVTWVKESIKVGHWLRGQSEQCIFAIRGRPIVELTDESTVLFARASGREHSRKPAEFYSMVEQLCPAPRYAELFSRTARKNWDGHGNEVGRFRAEAAE
jgi:N6-adenosine-specific RNA methylase IME4